ncbi:Dynamitin-domain-containing protein [Syncephalis plumigaleata]|nr:Dynamitin-domain-containing protein [Syncephalis plumigaleata]
MSSKYASLPDIDTAPDIYETPDVPEVVGLVDKESVETAEENENIDSTGLSASDATRTLSLVFIVNTAPGETIASGEYEVLPREPALQETPVQKLRRLMFEEMTEIAQPSDAEGDTIQHSVILAQVNTLRYERLLMQQSESSRRLLARLEKIRQGAVSSSEAGDESRAIQLESRLTALERLVGHERGIDAEPTEAIAPVIAKLEQQLELLTQPRQMELVARRAKALAHELERVQRYKAEDDERIGINTETTKKINQLFATLDRLDPLIPLAPALVQRLKNLEQLHARRPPVEQEQSRLATGINNMEEQCTKIATSLKDNEAVIQRNVEALDRRIADLVERVAKLGVH